MVRRIPDYEEIVGIQLFQKFFSRHPDAQLVLGFPKGLDLNSKEAFENPKFVKEAKLFVRNFIQMIDKALDMLGPDVEVLTEILLELGKRHVSYGVRPEWFPAFGRVLIEILEDALPAKIFTSEIKGDWIEVYGAISNDMIRGIQLFNAENGRK